MIIAVDINYPSENNLYYHNNFIVECFNRIAGACPQYQFVYLVDKNFDNPSVVKKNTKTLLIPPYPKAAAGRYWWHHITLPAILKKHDVSVLVSSRGGALRGNIRQCIIINNLSQLIYPQYFNKKATNILKKNIRRFVKQATNIVALSQYCKNIMARTYSAPAEKIQVIYPGISPFFTVINPAEKEKVKAKFTGGIEYFLYIGLTNATENLIAVLKAFSQFKKWQKSNMQLIIADKNNSAPKEFLASLNTYKYKDGVQIAGNLQLQEYALLIASAYAAICPSSYNDFEMPVAEAMQCGVPVIAGSLGSMPEIAGNAALYVNPDKVDEIARQMILLYKDENKRAEMIAAGLQQAQQFNWEKAAAALWQSVLGTIK